MKAVWLIIERERNCTTKWDRFTTAKISVDMSNVINGSSKADMEGIVTHLKTRLEEEMSAVAEGVH